MKEFMANLTEEEKEAISNARKEQSLHLKKIRKRRQALATRKVQNAKIFHIGSIISVQHAASVYNNDM